MPTIPRPRARAPILGKAGTGQNQPIFACACLPVIFRPYRSDLTVVDWCVGRSVSSLSFYGSTGLGTPGTTWWDGDGIVSSVQTYDKPPAFTRGSGDTVRLSNSRPVKPYGAETRRSASSFGITTQFDSSARRFSQAGGARPDQHQAPAIYALWPGSKRSRGTRLSRSSQRPQDREEGVGGDVAGFEEAASPDSIDSPLPPSSWTEKPRIGYLFSIQDDGRLTGGRFGGAPQLTTKIADHRLPTPSRFRTAGVQPFCDLEEDKAKEGSVTAHGGYSQPDPSSAAGHASMHSYAAAVSNARAVSHDVSSPISAPRHKVSMHASVDLMQEQQQQVWVAPESPDLAERPSSIHPLQFMILRPTRKDNVRVFHRSYM